MLERLVETRLVVAGVVGERHRRVVREIAGLDEVPAPDLRRIDAHFPGRRFHAALHHVGRLRSTGTAVGVNRRGVGIEGLHFDVDRRRRVLPRHQRAIQICGHGRGEGGEIGAHVGLVLHPQTEEFPVRVQRKLRGRYVVASVGVRQEGLRSLGPPLHRPAYLARRPDDGSLLRVDEDFGTKAAAHIRGDHPKVRFRGDVDERRQHEPFEVRILRRRVQRVGTRRRVVLAERRTGLDGVGDQAVVDDIHRGDVVGAVEGGIRRRLVAEFPVVGLVVRYRFVDLVRRSGRCQIDDGGKFLEVRFHRFRAVLGGFQGFADDHRVGFADVVDRLGRDRRMRRRDHVRAVLRLHQPAAGQVADFVGGEIRSREDRHDPVRCRCRRRVHAVDLRPCVGRANEDRVGLSSRVDVVGVVPRPGDEAGVLLALDRGADACF